MLNNTVNHGVDVIRPMEILRETWQIMRDEYVLFIAIVIVAVVASALFPPVLLGPMLSGVFICLLDKVDGNPVKFDKVFQGFRYFLPSFLFMLAVLVPLIVLIVAFYIPLIKVMLAAEPMTENELWQFLAVTFAIEGVVAFVIVCFHTLLLFGIPLIVDRKMSALEAIKASSSAVWNNLSGVVGLMCISFAAAIAGYLLLCFGIYLVMPLVLGMTAVAYRKIFPALPRIENDPAYQDSRNL
jgi:uncharacterized membrane protein